MNTYQLFESGYCYHCQRMTLTNGCFKQSEYPALCALIRHPDQGYILFDTGYSDLFFQLTRKFPYSLYRYLMPVTLKKTLKQQLFDQNIKPTDINYIVISHFHADHIGGLSDYPNARFICHQDALNKIRDKHGFQALLLGFLPDLLPKDFFQRILLVGSNPVAVDPILHPFSTGFDLFGDKSMMVIPLPGHAKGHIGLYVKASKDVFFVADSCWHQESFKNLIYPSQLTYLAVHDNKTQYIRTIQQLHELYLHNKRIDIIPSHCLDSRTLIGATES